MPSIKWTPAALRDVARLHDFLAANNPDAARRAVKTIRGAVKMLAAHPEIGRAVEDMLPGFREWFIEFGHAGYLAIYHLDGDEVVILALRHTREAGY